MKKVILGCILPLISIACLACRNDPFGQCGNDAYFITRDFNPNSVYEYRIEGTTTTILTFTTNSKVTDSIFSLVANPGAGIEFRYKELSAVSFNTWAVNMYASTYKYAACGVLSVRLYNFYAQKDNKITNVSFDAINESNVKLYVIKGSVDSKDWVILNQFTPTGARRYNIPVSDNGPMSADMGLLFGLMLASTLLVLYVNAIKNKKYLLIVPLLLTLCFYSCKKATIDHKINYKFFQVDTIDQSNTTNSSQIIHS